MAYLSSSVPGMGSETFLNAQQIPRVDVLEIVGDLCFEMTCIVQRVSNV